MGKPARLLQPDPAHGLEIDRALEAGERADHGIVGDIGTTNEKVEQVADVVGRLGASEGRIGGLVVGEGPELLEFGLDGVVGAEGLVFLQEASVAACMGVHVPTFEKSLKNAG